jgi:hypothetical protein
MQYGQANIINYKQLSEWTNDLERWW